MAVAVETGSISSSSLRFIDLFAGLGGFHLALSKLGHSCVFASELDEELRDLYKKNFGVEVSGDIRKVPPKCIPEHDILTAGFPCQPFSKAGDQTGLRQREYARLLRHVLEIIRFHHPRYIILENVPNMARHDSGQTWALMRSGLEKAGYEVQYTLLSPHLFGIPHSRERMIIVAAQESLANFRWPEPVKVEALSIQTILEHNPSDAKPLAPQVVECLNTWQQFIESYPGDKFLPTFPIWAMEFGADYPFEDKTPYALGGDALEGFKGANGVELATLSPEARLAALPSYAQTAQAEFPAWKKNFIRRNRQLYADNQQWIDEWLPQLRHFPASLQKLEWNHKGGERDIWKHIIQFRPSGVRVKKPTMSPSLIAMNITQVPIIAWERRYITVRECLRLQSMDALRHLPKSQSAIFRSLGNAVNVRVIELVIRELLSASAARLVLRENDTGKSSKEMSTEDRLT